MYMNWGYKIMFAYLVFVAGILFLVFKASQVRFDLVEKDYYAAELQYQDRIDAASRTAGLSQPPVVALQNRKLQIQFPPEMAANQLEGELHLYFPADAHKDLRQPFQLNGQQGIEMEIPQANRGLHKLKLYWKAVGQSYFFEETLFL